jgi:3-deoxy-D-manno-octulosonate 8-phosphate phosphatase (KDO 8-P phosphatase)
MASSRDGRVWTDENGRETVAASRSDSMRIRQLRERGIEVMILSSEVNPVVKARAEKDGHGSHSRFEPERKRRGA